MPDQGTNNNDGSVFNATTDNNSNGGGATNPPPQNNQSAPNNQLVDLLSSIKDENGRQKYSNVEDALKALSHSQNHISTLEQEARQKNERLNSLEQEFEKLSTLEKTIEELTKQRTDTQATPNNSSLDKDTVLDLVRKELEQRNSAELLQRNINKVNETLKGKFGEKAADIVVAKARELNTTPEELKNLAGKNPNLVLDLFKETKTSSVPNTTSSVNFPPNRGEENTPPRPTKSVLQGATSKEQVEFFKQVRDYTNKRLGIETKA